LVRVAQEGAPLEQGDCLEVFVTPQRGSTEGYRLIIAPGTAADPTPRSHFEDYRKTTAGEVLTAEIAGKRTPQGYLVEACLPWSNLKVKPEAGAEFGLQLFASDDDGKGEKNRFRALWHPAGDPRRDPLAYQTFHLAAQPSAAIRFTRGEKPDKSGLYTAEPPFPFPVELPPLGGEPEDVGYTGTWSSNVTADDTRLVAELAIPWQTLRQAGLAKDRLMFSVNHRGPLREPPVLGGGFERLLMVARELAQPRTVSVRLHFAELEDVQPGQRIFDVKLQDKIVLEGFDVVAAAGSKHRAVVRQFDDILATRAVSVELLPGLAEITSRTAPTLCGIEILAATQETAQ